MNVQVREFAAASGVWTQGFSTADDFEDSDNEHVLDFWS